jgi:hypothetical protein
MCMSCGCGEPHETHGDRRNITYADLKKAGDASKISVKEVCETSRKRSEPRILVRLLADDSPVSVTGHRKPNTPLMSSRDERMGPDEVVPGAQRGD